jgi:hypothetical protein
LKIRLNISIIIYLTLLWCNTVLSQVIVDLKTKGVEDGLDDRLVTNICRDKFGFFYLTSEVNIQKYDGEKFTDLDISKMMATKINPSDVLAMTSVKGDIYLSTLESSNLFYIKAGSNKVECIKLNKVSKVFFIEDEIYLSTKNDKNNTFDVGLYDITKNSLKYVFTALSTPVNIIKCNNQFIVQDDKSIYKMDNNKPQLITNFSGKILSSNKVLYLADHKSLQSIDQNGVQHLLYKVKGKTPKVKIFKKDKSGNLIFATTLEQDYTNNAILISKDSIYDLDNIIIPLDNKFRDVYSEDFTHKIMTVGHQGIYVFTFMQEGATQILKTKNLVETFGDVVTGIAGNGKNEVLFLCEDKGFYKVIDNKEKAIFKDNKNLVGNGKMVYHKKNNKYYCYSDQYSNPTLLNEIDLNKNKIKSIKFHTDIIDLTPRENIIYIVGKNKENNHGEILTLNMNNLDAKPSLIFSHQNAINGILFHEDLIWISTIKGILICDKNFKIIRILDRYQQNKKYFLEHDIVRDLQPYNGKILAGALGGGIYIIDPNTHEVINALDKKNGLTDNKAIGILEDNQGYCWIATWNGLNVINKDFKVIKTIYQHQGLPDKELNTKAYYKDEAGILYFGSINGLIKIDPIKVLKWKLTHGLFLKNAISISDSKTEYLQNTHFFSDIKQLKLEFSAPDYYVYGYDISKIDISSLSKNKWQIENLTASIIDPKNEEKKIKVFSTYSDFTYDLNLEISTNYTQFLKIAAILGFFSFIGFFIVKRIEKNEAEKTANNKKIIGLELSALQGQMNPHFIFNSLGAIQYFIQTHDAEKADDYLSNFAKLMRMILESSKSRYITIKDEIKLLDLYIGLEQIRFEEKFSYVLQIDEDLDLDFKIPPMIIQPFIENAINHGLVNLKDKEGELKLSVKHLKQNILEFTIKDNGIGRNEAQKFINKTHISRGMQIVKERIESFNESNFNVGSKIIDLYDTDGKSEGTMIVILFKDNS